MGCNCSKKKLSTSGKTVVKKSSTQTKKPVVRTSARRIVRRTAR